MKKLGIRQKLRLLVLSGGLLGLTLFGILSLSAMWSLWEEIDEHSTILGEETGVQVSYFVRNEERERLMEVTRMRARVVDYYLHSVQNEVFYMKQKLSSILKSPQLHSPRVLPNATYEDVLSREPYVHFAPDLVKQGVSDSLLAEIRLASNIADDEVFLTQHYSNYYPCVFVSSRKGYSIRVDVVKEGELVPLARAKWHDSYDPRRRSWYETGSKNEEPIFTDAYYTTSGEPCLSCVVSYEDAEGFAGVLGIDVNLDSLHDLLKGTSFNDNEVCFLLDSKGGVLSSTQEEGLFELSDIDSDLREVKESPQIVDIAERMVRGEEGYTHLTIEGKEYRVAFSPISNTGWSFGTIVAAEDFLESAKETFKERTEHMEKFRRSLAASLLEFLAGAIACVGLLLVIPYLVSGRVARHFSEPVMELEDGAREISKGNLDKRIDLKTEDEFGHLAACFNAMAHDLKLYMDDLAVATAEKEQVAAELNVATNIQHDMLPNIFPPFPQRKEIDIYAVMHPAKEVGGDFYDFYFISENRLVITIADVSDKGVPAALFMVISKTLLKNFSMMEGKDNDLARAVARTNDQLCQSNKEDMFVTVFTGVLDVKTGEFNFVNAGHNPPLVRHGKEGFSYIPPVKKNVILGVMPDMSFQQKTIQLAPGDSLFLYTDGVTEAMNAEKNMFSEEKLQETLSRQPVEIKPEELIAKTTEAIHEHVKETQQSDDITMLVLKFKGSK